VIPVEKALEIVLAHARANALVVMAPQCTSAGPEDRFPALLLGNFLERDGTD
jgi:hypothetical protein